MASHDLHCSPEMCISCREEVDRLREREKVLARIVEEVAEHLSYTRGGAHNCLVCGDLYRSLTTMLAKARAKP